MYIAFTLMMEMKRSKKATLWQDIEYFFDYVKVSLLLLPYTAVWETWLISVSFVGALVYPSLCLAKK